MKRERTPTMSLAMLIAAFLLLNSFFQPGSRAVPIATLANDPFRSMAGKGINPQPPSPPDITSQVGITIGGHSAPWGGAITLTAADAVLVSGGRCAFNVSYDMKNLGTTATSVPFKNSLRLGSTEVSSQTNLSLAAGAMQQINTQAYLDVGSHILGLWLDSDHVVAESNEANNVRRVKVKVSCASPRPDITSLKGITIGGAIGGAGGKFAAWGGVITLTLSDAMFVSNGTCAFNISYDMENIGAGPTSPPFLNRLRLGSTVVSIQSNLSLAAGATRQINTQAYLARGGHSLSLSLDNDLVVSESNEANNVRKIRVSVQCP